MNYKQAEEYLFGYTDYEKMPMPHDPAFYDLRRVEELLLRLGNPHLAAKSVHIAGTKGKGSVAAMIASALAAAGYTTGLYTSPHLHTWRERMRVNGELISEAEFVNLVARLKPEVEAVNRKATYGRLTTFELLTALGFAFFKSKKADFQVLEVGMGGRFDATNVINPEVAVITSISLDHTDVLGDSPARIAGEKTGIIKSGGTVVSALQTYYEVARVIKEACRSRGARLIRVGRDVTGRGLGFDTRRQRLEVKGRLDSYQLSLPLLGQHQLENAAVAVAALEALAEKGFRISRQSIINGLGGVSWPGRFQILSRQPRLVVDGAHNPDSARRLRQSLEQYFGLAPGVKGSLERAILVIGVSCDKDIAGIATELAPLFDRVLATRSLHPRAMAVAPIVAEFAKYGVEAQLAEDVPAALRLALGMAGEKGLVCVAGSLFVVGEAIAQAEIIKP